MWNIHKAIGCLLRGRRFYVAVAALCLLEWLALSRVAPNIYFDSDTVSYFYPVNLFAGCISDVRPPVYCLFLDALRSWGDAHLQTAVVLSQFAVMLAVLLLAAKMLRSLFRHNLLVLAVCGLLALQSYFWCKAINPESFSFCVVALAVCLWWRISRAPSKTLVWSLHLLMAFAILLKPVFVVLAIALFLSWMFRIAAGDEDRRRVKTIVLSFCVSCGLVLGYGALMQARHGFFGLSSVSVQNDLLDIVSSGAWTTCRDSPVKAHLAEALQKSADPYNGAFSLQWAVVPDRADPTDLYEICPKFLFESANVRYCYNLRQQYDKGTLYPRSVLQEFVREAKRQPLYVKYEIQKLMLALGAPQGVLLVPFWLGVTALLVSLARRDHVLVFANLLFRGFIATVVFKSDMEQNARLLYPVCLVPWMDLLHYFMIALQKRVSRSSSLPSPT